MTTLHIDNDFNQIEEELERLLGPNRPDKLSWYGTELRKQRKAKGWNQSKLALITGIKQPKISELETGGIEKLSESTRTHSVQMTGHTSQTDIVTLYVLANALDAQLSDIAFVPTTSSSELSSEQILHLQPQLLEVEKITTLIRPDAKTFLRDIYYRTILIDKSTTGASADRSVAFQADSLSELRHSACVILGTAGQGKSILLRYLTGQEALGTQTLPLFFELRQLGSAPVREQILNKLRNWNLCQNLTDLALLFAKGRVSLLFDAFDELPLQRRQSFLTELSEVHDANPELRIVVSARPDSGIMSCHWLHPYSINPLKPTDVESLIRIYAKSDDADLIVSRIKDADIEVIDLLRSPIFVVLLIIKFQHSQYIPRNIIAFYADLFDALVRRHNSGEGTLKREISSKLQPRQLENAFKSICYFLHRRFGDQSPHLREVQTIAEVFTNRRSLGPVASSLVVDDIIKITNLMLEEAGICYFVHKTVKEYFAAVYVAENATDEQAEMFYQSLQRDWREWVGILMFLEHIDRDRYLKMFAIPGLKRFAPYRAIDIARSFRKVSVSKNDDETFNFSIELSETECHAFNQPSMISYGVLCEQSDLQSMFGREETDRICSQLEVISEVILDRDEYRMRYPTEEWDYTPIVEEIGNHLTGDGFDDFLKSWEQEVQMTRSPDADFEIG